jgi:hypothetical protein
VTAAAGIRFRHTTGGFGRKLMPEPLGSGCAFWDYDGDGKLDVLLLNGRSLATLDQRPTTNDQRSDPRSTLALYRNEGGGRFTDVTRAVGLAAPMYAMGCSAADYDNDGDSDLYVTALGPGRLFRNDGAVAGRPGSCKFTDVTAQAGVANAGAGRWGTSCAWLDYDRDGRLDLFVANYVSYDTAHDLKCLGALGQRVYCTPLHYKEQPSVLYRNRGDRFEDVSRASGIGAVAGKALGVAVCDVDRDRLPDLYVANDTTQNLLFRNRGNGTFAEEGMMRGLAYAETGVARAGMGIDVGEPLNDGRLMAVVSNFAGEGLTFFREEAGAATGTGEGLFQDATLAAGLREPTLRHLGFGLLFFDADNDGRQEIFAANGHIQNDIEQEQPTVRYRQPHQLFRADAGGVFQDISARAGAPFAVGRVSRGAAVGDYDGDGDLDLLVNNNGGAPELLRNDGGNRRHWLHVDIKGRPADGAPASNRDGLGAEVVLVAGGVTQRRLARTGSSYCSQSMLGLHFGLGTATVVDSIQIRWPSGREERRERLAVDQRITISEGEM